MGILHCTGSRGRALLFVTITLHLYYTEKLIISGNILPGDTLSRGINFTHYDVLRSKSGEFQLEFFPLPDQSNDNYYLGIKWKAEYIWLANRDNPLNLVSDPVLLIDEYGNMEISYNGATISIYSSEAAEINHRKIIANVTLTDNGSFDLYEKNENGTDKQLLWTSFDSPNNILLPGMKLGFHIVRGNKWNLTSWAASQNPALGSFTLGIEMDSNYTIQLVLWWRGNPYWTSGPWLHLEDTRYYYFKNMDNDYVSNSSHENEISIVYEGLFPGLNAGFFYLNPQGELHGTTTYVSCNSKNPALIKGCMPPKPPKCRQPNAYVSMHDNQYGIMSKEGYKIEGTENLPLYDCGIMYCLMNCSCQAYSPTNNDGTGCQIWDYSINFEESPDGQQIYFIQDNPGGNSDGKTKKNHRSLIIACVIGGALLISISAYICHLMKKCRIEDEKKLNQEKILHEIGDIATPFSVNRKGQMLSKEQKASNEIHIFSLKTIVNITDNFSSKNKLGEGGFGPVYKGKLADGQEIAVKRLSKSSRQGLMEFKNEIKLIVKLQHTNLVRLCGFCFEGEENMLIYEYMPNKSLDFYLFDTNNRNLLDWKIRYNIIQGIAQGLVYLHKFSRLRVIHRDMKPSNILLDCEMNPKISDFGLARIFGSKESQQDASRLVGTYGYMSPEYALNGIVSIKTDIFSFGVILLEIISGKKNTSCFTSEDSLNLIGFAWKLWNESRASQLVDPILSGTSTSCEIFRCIHIGLLCVQDLAKDRPTMLEVVSFLSNETILLAEPKQPAFFINDVTERRTTSTKSSINDVTISEMGGR